MIISTIALVNMRCQSLPTPPSATRLSVFQPLKTPMIRLPFIPVFTSLRKAGGIAAKPGSRFFIGRLAHWTGKGTLSAWGLTDFLDLILVQRRLTGESGKFPIEHI